MRLIHTEGSDDAEWVPRLRTRRGDEPYAILSHCWYRDSNSEILFADIQEIDTSTTGTVRNSQYVGVDPRVKPAFQKLRGAAQRALKDGYDCIWVDTCCIDKNSSAELSEAINSMFRWYSASGICYAYLSDCTEHDITIEEGKKQLASSQWWTRGWTLQELLAPQEVIFFSSAWVRIGRKNDPRLTPAISEISGIDVNVVNGTIPLDTISIAQRMSWAADRVTSRIEDIAYSLVGIFSVNMPLLYGEGDKAYLRLQQGIMKESDDETIFAWIDEDPTPLPGPDGAHVISGLLAAHPSAFRTSRSIVQYHDIEHPIPFSMTNNGLSISLRLDNIGNSLFIAQLNCMDSKTNAQIGIYLRRVSPSAAQYARDRGHTWAPVKLQAPTKSTPLYVKQFHNQLPAYKNLDHRQRTIRLIQVLPTGDTFDMKLRLLTADVETARYTAVSYVWDKSGQDRNIWLNSEQVKIPNNLFMLLQKLRHHSLQTLFWIDTICIDQLNRLEKNYQVVLMADIYRYATCVLVLLDKITLLDNRKNQHAISSFQPLTETKVALTQHDGNKRNTPRRVIDRQLASNILALTEIAQHKYWTRSWVVQEFLVARDIVLQLDAGSIPITSFAQTYFPTTVAMKQRGLFSPSVFQYITPFLRFAKSTARFNLEAENRRALESLGNQRLQIKFEELLDAFDSHVCVVPVDRVYSLVNISDLGTNFVTDYTESSKDLLFRIVAARGNNVTSTALSRLQQALEVDLSTDDLDRLHQVIQDNG